MINYKNNKGFIIIFSISIILFLTDFITTLMNSNILKFLEINPLYRATGTLLWPILLNIGLFSFIFWFYNRTTPATRFIITNALVIIAFLRVLAIKNAVSLINNPITPEQAAIIATPQHINAAMTGLAVLAWTPMLLSIIVYIFWSLDHKITKKGDKL